MLSAERQRALAVQVVRAAALAAGLVVYAGLLMWIYLTLIVPTFGYLGERGDAPDLVTFSFALIAAWLVAMALPRTVSTLGDFIVWVLFVLMIFPVMVVPHFAIATSSQAAALTVAAGLSFLPVALLLRGPATTVVPVVEISPVSFWGAVLVVTLACYALIAVTTPVSLAVPSISDVYGLRSGYRELVLTSGPAIGYVVRLLGNVLNPLLIIRGIYGGPRWLIAVGFAGQLVVYSITGYKLTLLSGVAILGIALWFRIGRRRGLGILLATLALVLASLALDQLLGGILVSTVFVYRMIILSGTLPAAYAGFFESNPHVVWSDSFLRPLIEPVYERPMAFVVGEYHTGSANVTVNSNYIADGLGNLGWWGVAIEAAAMSVLLLLLVSAARRLPVASTSGLVLTPLIALVNSSPFTAVLSNGFLLLIIILAVMPRPTRDNPPHPADAQGKADAAAAARRHSTQRAA